MYLCTCGGMFFRRRSVAGFNEDLLSAGLHHVNIFADLLEGHLFEMQFI